jgi:hypothetical protein
MMSWMLNRMRAIGRSLALGAALALALAPAAEAAGGKSSAYENALLLLVFQGTTITGIAQNASSSPATVLCVALHTSDPGVGGTQSTNEAAYGGYARISVARSSSGWTVSGNAASLAALEQFPAATSGSETETYFSVAIPTSGSSCGGSLVILYRGPITPNLVVSTGVTPELTTSTQVTEQ